MPAARAPECAGTPGRNGLRGAGWRVERRIRRTVAALIRWPSHDSSPCTQRTKPQVTATASSSGAVQAREVSASGPERLFGAQGGGGLGRGGPAGGPECAEGGDAQSGQGQQQKVGDTQDVHKAAGQHYAAQASRRR